MAGKNRKKKKIDGGGGASSGTMATNRRVRFDYHMLDDFEAGLVLKGSEIKSIRDAKVDISNAYVRITDGEAWLMNAYIAPYEAAGFGRNMRTHYVSRSVFAGSG